MATLAVAALLALTQNCAPQVAPITILALAQAESRLDPLTIGINSRPHRALHFATLSEAAAMVKSLQARGADFDAGLTQINSRNFKALGLTPESVFEPCRNLAAGADLLTTAFLSAAAHRSQPGALRAALSTYNTGDPERGLRNGYVAKIYRAAAEVVPALLPADHSVREDPAPVQLQPHRAASAAEPAPTLDVFSSGAGRMPVWPSSSEAPVPADPPGSRSPLTGDAS